MASIVEGLFAGRAGIQSHGAALSVLADNIANSNTTAFKSSRPDFATLLSGSVGGASSATTVGSGSTLNAVTEIFAQGTFEDTGRGLDAAIEGNGFFVVEDIGGSGQRLYTRAGNFSVDKSGYLVNQNGYNVMGFPAAGANGIQALNVNQISLSSVSTTEVEVGGNLNADDDIVGAIPDVSAGATFADLADSAGYSTTATVYDGLGAAHDVSIYFFHTDVNEWTANAYIDAGDLTGGTAGDPALLGSVAMDFNGNGTLIDGSTENFTVVAPDWANGAATTDFDFTFETFTQFAASSSVDTLTQNGTGGGSVVSFNIEGDGTLFAQLSNGETASIGRIALANFANPDGLKRAAGSLYLPGNDSGEVVIGNPGAGTFGTLAGGSLELSTSDLAGDFVKLISIQRGFQGSSRIITSINDLLSEIVNLAR